MSPLLYQLSYTATPARLRIFLYHSKNHGVKRSTPHIILTDPYILPAHGGRLSWSRRTHTFPWF